MITVLGLDIGKRETKRSSGAPRRSKFVGDGGVGLAQGGGRYAPTLSLVDSYTLSEELGGEGS